MVREYQLTGSSLELICSLSDSLYDWKQPERPEDLALLRVDDSVFMGSISHEKDAFVSLSDDELRLLREKIPDLQIAL